MTFIFRPQDEAEISFHRCLAALADDSQCPGLFVRVEINGIELMRCCTYAFPDNDLIPEITGDEDFLNRQAGGGE